MYLSTIFLCEYAKFTVDNKLDVMGLTSKLIVPELPFNLNFPVLVFTLDFKKQELKIPHSIYRLFDTYKIVLL